MSTTAVLEVQAHAEVRGTPFLVLERIADHVHVHGRYCRPSCPLTDRSFPSVARIADQLRLSRRSVHRALRVLEERGYLTTLRTGRSSHYTITLTPPELLSTDVAAPVENPVGEQIAAPAPPVDMAHRPVSLLHTWCANLAHDLSGSVHASRERAREAPPDPGEGEEAGLTAHGPPGCRHHEHPHPSCASCRAFVVLGRAKARADARSAAREARAERDPGGYGPRGNRPGPSSLADVLGRVVVGIGPPDPAGAS